MAIFKANQRRGSWVAELLEGFEELGVPKDDPLLPVIIDDGRSKVDWKALRYVSPAAESGLADWWNRPEQGEWRRLLLAGRPILLRAGMDQTTRTAGKKIGYYAIEDIEFGESEFSFRIRTRLGSCA